MCEDVTNEAQDQTIPAKLLFLFFVFLTTENCDNKIFFLSYL